MSKRRAVVFIMVFCAGLCFGALPFLGPLIPGKFPVEIRVDFGPAGKPALTRTLEVDRKTTPKEAVSLMLPVMSGKVCSSMHDLLEIDGVRPDAVENFWWILTVNGSRRVSPYRTHLKRGDLVEWRYLKEIEGEKSGKEKKL